MIKLVPPADSPAGRILLKLGRLLGLRSETVYSRALLLLTLFLLVLGGAVSAGVWYAMLRQFDRAGQERFQAAALRTRDVLAARTAVPGQPPVPEDLREISLLLDRKVRFLQAETPKPPLAAASADTVASAPWVGEGGETVGWIEIEGQNPFTQTGEIAARVFLLGLTVAGGVTVILVFIVLDRTVLSRIQLLAQKVEHEKDSERLPVQLNFPGDDELAQLASSIEELALLVQAAEREYRNVVEDQTEGVCRFDGEGRIIIHNRAFEALCQRVPEGTRPKLDQCLDTETMRLVRDTLARLTPEAPVSSFTHSLVGADAFSVWYRSTIRAHFEEDGGLGGGQWIAVDVTSEVAAQRRLQESQRQLQALSGRLMDLQDQERRRIARELHDSTAQNLSALEMNTSVLEALAEGERSRKVAAETRAISRQVCLELRNISYLLHPPLLEEQGLVFAIRWFAEGFTKRNNIPVVLDLPDGGVRLEPEIETALFRIVQEALGNIYRHAGATKAWITLRQGGPEGFFLEVRDNGRGLQEGFTLGGSSGVGLAGMRERMNHIGGTLEVVSSPYGLSIQCYINPPDADPAEEEA